jgi:hypothetical protein
MNLRLNAAVLALLGTVGCAAPVDSASDTTWVGTITTEGNVTTVVNESGSVWAAPARLVEEARIGVASGADEYMFGNIVAVYASSDRIYVADDQVPIVRSYDLDGNFVRVIGSAGEGPGEYTAPRFIGGSDDGRIWVEARGDRMNVYSAGGELLADFTAEGSTWPTVVTPDGVVYRTTFGYRDGTTGAPRYAIQGVTEAGRVGEPIEVPNLPYERLTVTAIRTPMSVVPFAPALVWNMTRAGSIVVGASDRYRFEVRHSDGPTLVVERDVDPVAVLPEEREARRKLLVDTLDRGPGSGFTWDGASMPDHKPAFGKFLPTHSGELWVIREGPSELAQGCVENPDLYFDTLIRAGPARARSIPCWQGQPLVDVFDAEGVYLGEVDLPEGVKLWEPAFALFVNGDTVIATSEDEAGTLYVKRYRLVLPGGEGRPGPAAVF